MVIIGDALQYKLTWKLSPPAVDVTEDPKQAMESLQRLLRLDFEAICFSHYPPMRSGGHAALSANVAATRRLTHSASTATDRRRICSGQPALVPRLVAPLSSSSGAASNAFGPHDAILFKPGFRYLRWSYDRLWAESGQVASLLQSRGLTKGDQVVIWGPNSPQWVLIFFGCLRAGVVAVPLDLRSAPDYVERVISRITPKLAFTSRFTPKNGLDLGLPEITFEELELAIRDLPAPTPVELAPDDLVEIMFTSGTTGDPKGVMLTHRNLTANIEGISQYITCDTSSRLLSILPLSHMYEQMGGLLMALGFGASVTYPTSRQPTVLARTMRERRITTLLLVPQGLELLMNGIEREVRRQGKAKLWSKLLSVAAKTPFRLRRRLFGRVHKQFGGKLDFIVSGGAALDPELGKKWELLGVKIVQGYGATEASPVISNHTLKRASGPDSVGRPLPNVEVRISEDGEILVRGDNITPGYWNAPEQTAAALQEGWYHTGDLGYFGDEGFLHIRGRVKDMIVLPSGQNVYPDDIQAVLNRHPDVTDSAVVGLSRGSAVEVHAAIILSDGADPEANRRVGQRTACRAAESQGLHRLARRRLPAHPHAQSAETSGHRHAPGQRRPRRGAC